MNIKISADSTCDLSPELVERYRIGIAPLYIVRDGESLVDGVDITPDEIYDHVAKGGSMCSTAAVAVYDYEEFFRKELESADAVVHFHISGDMSACYQNACIAAAEVGNVYPVDARNLSTGIGLLVLEAAELAQNGQLTAQEIQQRMEQRRELLDVSFLVEQLGYLRKGGPVLQRGGAGRQHAVSAALHSGEGRQDGRGQKVPGRLSEVFAAIREGPAGGPG